MSGILIRNLYLYLLMLVLAVIEIQIEGQNGWAVNLPTWKVKEGSWFDRLYKKIMSGKIATGYHLAVFTFVLMILHLPFVFSFSWRWWSELEVLSLFFLFIVFWDFLWFILNPHYGLKKFKAVEIWWHNQWLGPWPLDYYWGVIISFLIYVPVMYVDFNALKQWFQTFITYIILTAIIIFVIEVYKMFKKTV